MRHKESSNNIELLVDCIRCQLDNPKAIEQALKTVATICSTENACRNALRKCKGLDLFKELLTTTTQHAVKDTLMYTLACAIENNVENQQYLATNAIFSYLHSVLCRNAGTDRTIQAACHLILTLVINNARGKHLVRKSGCLETMMELLRENLPSRDKGWNQDLVINLCSTICTCVNNPQNDTNQRLCSSLYPPVLRAMEEFEFPHIIKPLSSFIRATVSGNVHNQESIDKIGGIEILVNCLYTCINKAKQGLDDFVESAVALSGAIYSVIMDHGKNASKCGSLGCIELLIKLLEIPDLDVCSLMQVVGTLGHASDIHPPNQEKLVHCGGLAALVQILGNTGDEELSNAVKYTLQLCVHKANSMEKETPNKAVLGGLENQSLSLNCKDLVCSPVFDESSVNRSAAFQDIKQHINKLQQMLNQTTSPKESSMSNHVRQQREQMPLGATFSHLKNIQPSQSTSRQWPSLFQTPNERNVTSSNMANFNPANFSGVDFVTKLRNSALANPSEIISGIFNALSPDSINRDGDMRKQLTDVESRRRRTETARESPKRKQPLRRSKRGANKPPSLCNDNIFECTGTPSNIYDSSSSSEDDVRKQKNTEIIQKRSEAKKQFGSMRTRNSKKSNKKEKHRTSETDNEEVVNLKKELEKERELRKKIQDEAKTARAALEEQTRKEEEAKKKAELLTLELERQQLEEESLNKTLEDQILEGQHFCDQLTEEKLAKEKELKALEVKLTEIRKSTMALKDRLLEEGGDPSKYETDIESVLSVHPANRCVLSQHVGVGPGGDSCKKSRTLAVISENKHTSSNTPERKQLFPGNINKDVADMSTNTDKISDSPIGNAKMSNLSLNKNRISSTPIKRVIPTTSTGKDGKFSSTPVDVLSPVTDHEIENVSIIKHASSDFSGSAAQQVLCVDSSCQTSLHINPDVSSKVDNTTKSRYLIAGDVISIATPFVADKTRTDDSLFVKPQTPLKYRNNQEQDDSVQRQGVHKRKLFTNDENMAQLYYKGKANTPRCPGSITSIARSFSMRDLPPSPAMSIMSTFDAELLNIAKQTSSNRHDVGYDVRQKSEGYSAKSTFRNSSADTINSTNEPRRDISEKYSTLKSNDVRSDRCHPDIITTSGRMTWDADTKGYRYTSAAVNTQTRPRASGSTIPVATQNAVTDRCSDLESEYTELDNVDPGDKMYSSDKIKEWSEGVTRMRTRAENTKKVKNITGSSHLQLCFGCNPPHEAGDQLLNSRTYNIAIETSNTTCSYHRDIREQERAEIARIKRMANYEKPRPLPQLNRSQSPDEGCSSTGSRQQDVYEFASSASSKNKHFARVSPPLLGSPANTVSSGKTTYTVGGTRKRPRVDYTEQEVQNILDGVEKMGRFWTQILCTYKFHPTRTAVDLKDKYKRMMAKQRSNMSSPGSTHSTIRKAHRPFSMVEERRLKRGVKHLGNNWTSILNTYRFSKGRTATELREKWRSMTKFNK